MKEIEELKLENVQLNRKHEHMRTFFQQQHRHMQQALHQTQQALHQTQMMLSQQMQPLIPPQAQEPSMLQQMQMQPLIPPMLQQMLQQMQMQPLIPPHAKELPMSQQMQPLIPPQAQELRHRQLQLPMPPLERSCWPTVPLHRQPLVSGGGLVVPVGFRSLDGSTEYDLSHFRAPSQQLPRQDAVPTPLEAAADVDDDDDDDVHADGVATPAGGAEHHISLIQ